MREKKPKRGFADGYKTYDTSKGFGSKRKWQQAFNDRIGSEEAAEELKDKDAAWVILGVSEFASQAEVKSAFRTLMKQWHPDFNSHRMDEATAMSKTIIAAYSIMMDNF